MSDAIVLSVTTLAAAIIGFAGAIFATRLAWKVGTVSQEEQQNRNRKALLEAVARECRLNSTQASKPRAGEVWIYLGSTALNSAITGSFDQNTSTQLPAPIASAALAVSRYNTIASVRNQLIGLRVAQSISETLDSTLIHEAASLIPLLDDAAQSMDRILSIQSLEISASARERQTEQAKRRWVTRWYEQVRQFLSGPN